MKESARLRIRVIPNAKKNEFGGSREGEIILRLSAPALEGKANRAAVDFLSQFLSVPKAAISIVAGEKSRHKIFEVLGLEAGQIESKLATINR
jgi:uncharacterized protein (TIGR00251 family)